MALEIIKVYSDLANITIIENDYGLMGCSDIEKEENFQYWLGMMFPLDTKVPKVFSYVDIPESNTGICWIYGNGDNGEVFRGRNLCIEKLKENGMGSFRDDLKGKEAKWYWYFERYNNQRFHKKDNKGKIILDYGFYIN